MQILIGDAISVKRIIRAVRMALSTSIAGSTAFGSGPVPVKKGSGVTEPQ